ncbi:MAG: bacteriocin [Coriobacteriales bacterium]|nr:bacteriocin [Coriobacteriales bacterium]
MTNEGKAEKVKAFAGEVAESSKELSEDDLKQISGGAFNMEVANRLGLDVKTGKSGTQGLFGTLTYQESSGSHAGVSRRIDIPISENSIRAYLKMPGELSVEARTTSGVPITLGINELMELCS